MSGHSKWHNIQKTKGAADAKRAQAFTKIAREMIVAVKEGGSGDPRSNSKLATVIAKAKAANMPNDNIKRTIEKALGSGNTDNYEKIVYEGYGPQGVAVIIETMTDNRNRTAGEMRHYFALKNTDDYYFLSNHGRQLTNSAVENIVKRYGSDIKGVRVSPHTCRHFYAQQQVKMGTDLYTISRLLGHENVQITQTYLNSLRDADVIQIAKQKSVLMSM